MGRRQLIGSRRRLVSTTSPPHAGPPPRFPAASCVHTRQGPEPGKNNFLNNPPPLSAQSAARERERRKKGKEIFRSVWRPSSHRSERASCELRRPFPAAAATARIRSVSSFLFACIVWLIGRLCTRRRAVRPVSRRIEVGILAFNRGLPVSGRNGVSFGDFFLWDLWILCFFKACC
jgi:hypothetical protein